ncbi:MAG: hypothetical protein SPLUMA1_SPLUMAMAG1_00326 [uncultured Sulfurimonas sp.]|nr:MAG: hypothetical protein SPLUMA1_SPLUMAMAG1_00326 [uncultured Sulfurimonas sp.]
MFSVLENSYHKRVYTFYSQRCKQLEDEAIENVWMTHSHLDHIIDIAYILDNYFNLRKHHLISLDVQIQLKRLKKTS